MPNINGVHKTIFEVDLTSKLVKTSNTVATLGSLTLTTSISGAGGIDSGSISSSTFYYVYCVISGGLQKLIASTSAISPTGFTNYRKVGAFYTDVSSNIFRTYFYGEINITSFAARVDISGVVSGENVDFINGNCTINSAGSFTVPLNTSTFSVLPSWVPVACDTAVSNAYGAKADQSSTFPNLLVYTINSSSGNGTTRPFNLTVIKSGIDAVQPDWSRL